MKKVLLKRCQKPLAKEQREKNMIIIGKELFNKKTPKVNIPIYKISQKGNVQ